MFLAINTSSVTLIASTVIAYRAAAGSSNPAEIIGPTIIASVFGTIVAIVAAKLLEKFPLKRR
jgi:spore maturation protein A